MQIAEQPFRLCAPALLDFIFQLTNSVQDLRMGFHQCQFNEIIGILPESVSFLFERGDALPIPRRREFRGPMIIPGSTIVAGWTMMRRRMHYAAARGRRGFDRRAPVLDKVTNAQLPFRPMGPDGTGLVGWCPMRWSDIESLRSRIRELCMTIQRP